MSQPNDDKCFLQLSQNTVFALIVVLDAWISQNGNDSIVGPAVLNTKSDLIKSIKEFKAVRITPKENVCTFCSLKIPKGFYHEPTGYNELCKLLPLQKVSPMDSNTWICAECYNVNWLTDMSCAGCRGTNVLP
jgi:hypothetical protein